MRERRPALLIVVGSLFVGAILNSGIVWAKRPPPADVAPVSYEGLRYEAPHFNNPCGQNGGCVVAFDEKTGTQVWSLKVYCTKYDSDLERDVQDVFITSLVIDSGRLVVANEKALQFSIDLASRAVTGDARGCDDGTGCTTCGQAGCSYSGSAVSGFSIGHLAGFLGGLAIVGLLLRARRGGR